jgi:DNA-binding MarR family transcriptional regulator
MAKTSEDSALALAGEMRMAFSAIKRRLRKLDHAGELTFTQKSVILLLERDGPATVAMLAKAEGVRHQSMRITVASLESMGAVRSQIDAKDKRQKYFQLTPAFIKTLKTARAAREDWLCRAIQTQLTTREQQELAAAIKLLNRLANY